MFLVAFGVRLRFRRINGVRYEESLLAEGDPCRAEAKRISDRGARERGEMLEVARPSACRGLLVPRIETRARFAGGILRERTGGNVPSGTRETISKRNVSDAGPPRSSIGRFNTSYNLYAMYSVPYPLADARLAPAAAQIRSAPSRSVWETFDFGKLRATLSRSKADVRTARPLVSRMYHG